MFPSRVSKNGFRFEILFEAVNAILASVTGLFIASERRKRIPCWIVDMNLPGPNAKCDCAPCIDILSLHMSAQSKARVVGDAHRFIDRVVGNDAKHRPENLLLCNSHPDFDLGENRGPGEEPLGEPFHSPGSSAKQLCSAFHACQDHGLDAVE